MIEQVEGGLLSFRAGVLPSKIKQIERDLAKDIYRGLVLGNLAALLVAEGLDDEEIEAGYMYDVIRELCFGALNDRDGKFHRTHARARERLHFIARQ